MPPSHYQREVKLGAALLLSHNKHPATCLGGAVSFNWGQYLAVPTEARHVQ